MIGRHAALPSQFRRASIGGGVLTFSLCGASGSAQDGLPCHPGFFAWIFFLVCMECREVSDIYLEPERALPPGTHPPCPVQHSTATVESGSLAGLGLREGGRNHSSLRSRFLTLGVTKANSLLLPRTWTLAPLRVLLYHARALVLRHSSTERHARPCRAGLHRASTRGIRRDALPPVPAVRSWGALRFWDFGPIEDLVRS